MALRPYQEKAVNAIFSYFKYETGNPLIVAPTGSGKSHLIASFVERALRSYPSTNATILAHRKELLVQNSEKLMQAFPLCPLGVFSAGLKRRERNQITMAGIATVYDKAELFGYQHLVLVDEAHLIPKNGNGMYRTFLDGLKQTNPRLKVVGFTATPFRMDSGMLIDGDDRLFTDIAYDIDLRSLINDGYLAPLVSKQSKTQADLSTARVRGGEFVQQDIERIMDEDALTEAALSQMIEYGRDRKSWIVFCAGVSHAEHVTEKLRARGINAACVVGDTPDAERRTILTDFKLGKIQALCNCDVLTTGFDAPNIDMLVLLRPTKSVGLYVQMCGRGCRLFEGKANCMVLDFAGNIERFGPLDMVKVKRKKSGKAESDRAPTKNCPICEAVMPIGARVCICGVEFPPPEREKHGPEATEAPILSEAAGLEVDKVEYKSHKKKGGESISLKATYYCGDVTRVNQFLAFDHFGIGRDIAHDWWYEHARDRSLPIPGSVAEALERTKELKIPKKIQVVPDGKYFKIVGTEFYKPEEEPKPEPTMYELFGVNI